MLSHLSASSKALLRAVGRAGDAGKTGSSKAASSRDFFFDFASIVCDMLEDFYEMKFMK